MDPSLQELVEFAIKHELDWSKIEYHIKNTYNGKYYIGGQILVSLDEPISDELIEQVAEKNKTAVEPANGLEMLSVKIHEERYKQLLSLRQKYLNHKKLKI